MTAPRVPLFQRKGPPKPSVMIAIGAHKPDPGDAGAGDDDGDELGEATCPNCGCEFDTATGEIKGYDKAEAGGKGAPPHGAGSGGDALANLFGGASQPQGQ